VRGLKFDERGKGVERDEIRASAAASDIHSDNVVTMRVEDEKTGNVKK
jgi:hypothetical protein